MKILHTADWHLASPMEHRLPPEKAALRRKELQSRFVDMVQYAVDGGFSAVLLCGDLSDDGVLPYSVQEYLLTLIADAAPVRFFLLAGNHDRETADTVGGAFTRGRQQIPENLHIFGPQFETVTLGTGVTVSGCCLSGETGGDVFAALPADTYNIVMLHGQLTDGSGPLGGEGELLPMGSLRGRNTDYLALGHEHTFRHGRLDARCTYCYCGCPEGRGFDECGAHGFVVLTLDGNRCRGAEFVPFAKRVLHDLSLDITAVPGGIRETEQALGQLIREIPTQDFVRVTVCGEEDPDTQRDLSYLEQRLEQRFFYAEIRDRRVLKADLRAYENDVSLRGAFVRQVLSADLPEDEKQAILRCGLSALRGETDI